MRKKKTIQEMREIVERYNKSNLTKKQFCIEQNLSHITFYKWYRRINPKKNKLIFTPVFINDSESKSISGKTISIEKITLNTSSKFYLEFPLSISPTWLSSLLKELV